MANWFSIASIQFFAPRCILHWGFEKITADWTPLYPILPTSERTREEEGWQRVPEKSVRFFKACWNYFSLKRVSKLILPPFQFPTTLCQPSRITYFAQEPPLYLSLQQFLSLPFYALAVKISFSFPNSQRHLRRSDFSVQKASAFWNNFVSSIIQNSISIKNI